jgi:hypothetical protein
MGNEMAVCGVCCVLCGVCVVMMVVSIQIQIVDRRSQIKLSQRVPKTVFSHP